MGKSHTFDLVLLDVNLPDISGWKVKESLGNTPVIYVTARDELGDKIRGLNGGAQDYISQAFRHGGAGSSSTCGSEAFPKR